MATIHEASQKYPHPPFSCTYLGKPQKSSFFNGSAIKALTPPLELDGRRKFGRRKNKEEFFSTKCHGLYPSPDPTVIKKKEHFLSRRGFP